MRAKFKCLSKMGIDTFTVTLEPVALTLPHKERHEKTPAEAAAGSGSILHPNADRSFFAGYPHGSITLSALTAEAAKEFEVGRETSVDFTLAAAPVVASQ